MPMDGRVSSLSTHSRASTCTTEVNNITNGNLSYKSTSGNHLVVDPNALFRAKDNRRPTIYDVPYTKPFLYDQQTPMKSTESDLRQSLQSDSSGAQKVFGYMYNLWRTGKLCDIIILTKAADILAHKVTLAAYSDFLADKFTEFSQGEVLNIDLSDVSEEIVRTVIRFVYTNEINISDENVVEILYCAEEIGVLVVSNMCMDHISQNINPQNAFQFFSAAHQRNLDQVKQKVMKYITENFKFITSRSEFGMMPFDILILLLYSDDLGIDSEIDVFVAIVRWVDHNRKERMRLAPSLLKCVRYQLIEVNFVITHIESADWMFRARECHDWLYDVLRYHALRATGSVLLASYPNQQSRQGCTNMFTGQSPPWIRTEDNILKATVRHTMENIIPTQNYIRRDSAAEPSVYSEQQRNIPPPPQISISPPPPPPPEGPPPPLSTRGLNTSVSTQSRFVPTPTPPNYPQIVAVGGIDLRSLDADVPGRYVYQYDPRNNEWRIMTTMAAYLHHHGVVSLSGKLYVIGGAVYDSSYPDQLGRATNSVQVYNPTTHQWYYICPMKENRAYHGVATWRGKIYVIGGENESKTKLDSIECYDMDTDSWRYVARMVGGPKIGVAVAVCGDCLYIVGGFSKDRSEGHVLADVECFDLKQERWIKKRPLSLPRCHANLVLVQGHLWLVGGRAHIQKDGNLSLASMTAVEEYDSERDVWSHVTDLDQPRHDAGCVALGPYIHAIGGVRTPNPFCLASVECINTDTMQKVEGIVPLPYPAAGLACCQL